MIQEDFRPQAARLRDEAVRLLEALVQIHSVTGDKEGYRAMASFLSEELDRLGFRTKRIDIEEGKPKVVGMLHPEAHPCLLFNGHVDVVRADSTD